MRIASIIRSAAILLSIFGLASITLLTAGRIIAENVPKGKGDNTEASGFLIVASNSLMRFLASGYGMLFHLIMFW